MARGNGRASGADAGPFSGDRAERHGGRRLASAEGGATPGRKHRHQFEALAAGETRRTRHSICTGLVHRKNAAGSTALHQCIILEFCNAHRLFQNAIFSTSSKTGPEVVSDHASTDGRGGLHSVTASNLGGIRVLGAARAAWLRPGWRWRTCLPAGCERSGSRRRVLPVARAARMPLRPIRRRCAAWRARCHRRTAAPRWPRNAPPPRRSLGPP